jgi:hypothetical protein
VHTQVVEGKQAYIKLHMLVVRSRVAYGFPKGFLKSLRRNFGLANVDGFGIRANECIYAYGVEKYAIIDAP